MHRLIEGFVKYSVQMGSGAMLCIPNFIKIGSAIQKLTGGGYTYRQHGDRINLTLFFQNMEGKLKMFRSNLRDMLFYHCFDL
jgi:hypothetical protein